MFSAVLYSSGWKIVLLSVAVAHEFLSRAGSGSLLSKGKFHCFIVEQQINSKKIKIMSEI